MANVMITFLLSGLWHGASWNFVIWGALNGLFLILFDRFLTAGKAPAPLRSIFVSLCWVLSLVFFRAQTFNDAMAVFSGLGFEGASSIYEHGLNAFELKLSLWLIIGVTLLEALEERKLCLTEFIRSQPIPIRYSIYLGLVASIIFLGSYGDSLNDQSFIYFQF